jgi:hypothetical protein
MQGISGYSGMPPPLSQEVKVTEKQGQELTDFLSDYDTENLSDENAKEIVSKIQELGITPGSGLASILGDSGIDARSLVQQAGISGPSGAGGPGGLQGGRPPPPNDGAGTGSETVDDAVVTLISDAVKAYEESDEAETLWSVLEPALKDAGYDTSQPLVDFYS